MRRKFRKGMNKLGFGIRKHKSDILTIVAIGGLITTAVLTVKATNKVRNLNEQYKQAEVDGKPVPAKEQKKAKAKAIMPAVIAGTVTGGAMIAGHCIDKKEVREASAVATAALAGAQAIKDRAVEVLGEEAAKELTAPTKEVVNEETGEKELVVQDRTILEGIDFAVSKYYDPNSLQKSLSALAKAKNKIRAETDEDPKGILDRKDYIRMSKVLEIYGVNQKWIKAHPEVSKLAWTRDMWGKAGPTIDSYPDVIDPATGLRGEKIYVTWKTQPMNIDDPVFQQLLGY